MNPLRGIKEINNSWATTIINALLAIKTLNFLVIESVLYICQSTINLHISRMNHIF